MNFYKSFSKFQKVFFIFFTAASIITFLLPLFLGKDSLSSVFSPLGITGLICTISGILVSIYTAKANIYGYVWWIINTITLSIIALVSSLYGQFIENFFIVLPLIIYGFIAWKSHMSKESTNKISINTLTKKQWLYAIIVSIACFIAYAIFLDKLPLIFYKLFDFRISADPQVFLDSITATLTIMAVLLTAKRYVAQWNFWIVSNSLGVIMFLIQTIHVGVANPSIFVGDLSNTLSLLQYLIGSIYGYIMWRRMYNEGKKSKLHLVTQ
ncbi:nicotinamide riboside transporter PnuC [Clostridium massiliamazoniense]|uniref:nicotinamide riboside transporter PnuC n=1 Tax=Clostridium massiliamazoniense TaxID=1347366 RepID=UPI0006D7DDD6|nr:nicotinamide riboside transporter PnuC [Clostridium massiliamazoniense]